MKNIIIVNEDEVAVRELVVAILRRAGYDVVEANGLGSLVAAVSAHQDEAVLVLTDRDGCEGIRAVEEVHALDFGIPIAMMSGGFVGDETPETQGIDVVAFLRKPDDLQPAVLKQRVAEIIEQFGRAA